MQGYKSFFVSLALLLFCGTQAAWGQVMDLGTLPGGTWAMMRDINDFGVAVGHGDNLDGNLRPIGVPLRGTQAFQWFDLGTLGGETNECCLVMCMEVANSRLIVGHAAIAEGYIHAFAWTKLSGMVDLGTLDGHQYSLAFGVNKSGTLIVGWSGVTWYGPDTLPVVWTPDGSGKTWKIHKLDMGGFELLTYWYAATANDPGQIVGYAWDDSAQNDLAFVWNRVPGKNEWKIMRLPVSAELPNAQPWDINQAGEIVGWVADPDWNGLPALWKPVAPAGSAWELTVLPTLSGLPQGWNPALGINDAGDIVGVSNDADWNWLAARWTTKDPNFVQVLGFPGDWSLAFKVNNNGIAVGGYGIGDNPERAVAVKFR